MLQIMKSHFHSWWVTWITHKKEKANEFTATSGERSLFGAALRPFVVLMGLVEGVRREKKGWWWSACEQNDDRIKSGCRPSSEQTNIFSSPCRRCISILFSHLLLHSLVLLPPPPPCFPWSFSHPPTLPPLHTFSTYYSSASSRFYDSLER